MKLRVTFGASSLAGANDGLDVSASAERYADALREALESEWPSASIEIVITPDRAALRAEASECASDLEARSAERTALDLAWVVKGCAVWDVRCQPVDQSVQSTDEQRVGAAGGGCAQPLRKKEQPVDQ